MAQLVARGGLASSTSRQLELRSSSEFLAHALYCKIKLVQCLKPNLRGLIVMGSGSIAATHPLCPQGGCAVSFAPA
jgi:hypothetical protein